MLYNMIIIFMQSCPSIKLSSSFKRKWLHKTTLTKIWMGHWSNWHSVYRVYLLTPMTVLPWRKLSHHLHKSSVLSHYRISINSRILSKSSPGVDDASKFICQCTKWKRWVIFSPHPYTMFKKNKKISIDT